MMKNQRWLFLYVVIGLALCSPHVFGQAGAKVQISQDTLNHSHRTFDFPQRDLNVLMQERLQEKPTLEELTKLLEKYKKQNSITSEEFSKALSGIKFDTNDPSLPKGLGKLLESMKKDSEKGKQFSKQELDDLVEKLGKTQPEVLSGNEPLQPAEAKPSEDGGEQGAEQNPPGEPPVAGSKARPAPADTEDVQADSPLARRLLEYAGKLDPALLNSPALQKALKDLSQHAGQQDPRWQKLSKGFDGVEEKLGGLAQSLHLHRLPEINGLSWPGRFNANMFPSLRPPERVLPSAGNAAPIDNGTAGAQGWQVLLVLGGLLGIAVLFWRILTQARQKDADAANQGWRLGPWPVDPAAVATREDLVRAFEYLSVLSLGPDARNWNHRAIAERLTDRDALSVGRAAVRDAGKDRSIGVIDTNPAAVYELTDLYERARYAPPSDLLPDEDLAVARRDLCLLARAGAA